MPSITLEAHYNGSEIVLDEPYELEPNVRLLVTVLSSEEAADRDDWLRLSAERLKDAYGDDEPEYSLNSIKKPNPDYDRR